MENMILSLFHVILNMSLTSCVVILAVLLLRLPLKKAPKIYSYLLWFVVLFRLLCPVTLESTLSVFRLFEKEDIRTSVMEPVPYDIGYQAAPEVNLYIPPVTDSVNQSLPAAAPYQSLNPMQGILFLASFAWITVSILLFAGTLFSYFRLKKSLRTAWLVKENVYQSDEIHSPFVCGLLSPRIYLPVTLTEKETEYIILHEKTHIKRFDYVFKLLWHAALILHWFNPFVWTSFRLMEKDMEMSCDEAVLQILGENIKADYSYSLLHLSLKREKASFLKISPLAFGETGLKSRIKNVLTYKKPVVWLSSLLLTVILLTAVTLLTDPKSDKTSQNEAGKAAPSQADTAQNNAENNTATEAETRQYQTDPDYARTAGSQSPMGESYTIKGPIHNINITITVTSKDFMTLIDQMVLRKNLTSTFQAGTDINTLDEYYEVQIVYDKYSGPSEYYLYQKNGIPYIQSAVGNSCINVPLKDYGTLFSLLAPDTDAMTAVEENLKTIMSSPLASSNPSDYLKDHTKECENIKKQGDKALYYMLSCLYKGEGDTLKGYLMMYLCEDILGNRSDKASDNTPPTEWYRNLYIRPETVLPDFSYQGDDKILKLVYETETKMHHNKDFGFTIVSPHLFGYYEEGDSLKIFATTLYNYYKLYDETLVDLGGGVVPSAMTFQKKEDGSYVLEKYEQATDGSYFNSSVKAYCVMPLSGKKIPGLAKEILAHYDNYVDLLSLRDENLKKYQKKYGLEDVRMKD
ncbi:M56 family metallopeptidase [Anaerocolumna xylanovorans]|uniref:Signal transducer regulating beta-lactamase production, contains metallopeptidase domain n=1 Tax=Anaerocolumna xylanovorans DSM 12503 TaxID=1121345 RepID=A0A1M7XYY3_9FIRM|nr:M56 family metallopeptidase [Anaerocolumna xylanovorans]SHO44302.1 Signal transducer regulating beta-lactamase production, contains metallopeptidase domain [Anaerocolumna xylanovorans DSM 12503]